MFTRKGSVSDQTETTWKYVEPKKRAGCWLCESEEENGTIKCNECSRCFHHQCVTQESEARAATTRSQAWYCPKCQQTRDRMAAISTKLEKTEAQLKDAQAETRKVATEGTKNAKKLRNEYENELRRIETENNDALKKMSEKSEGQSNVRPENTEDIEDLLNSLKGIQKKLKETQERAEQAEKKRAQHEDPEVLRKILAMQQKILESKQVNEEESSPERNNMLLEMFEMQKQALELQLARAPENVSGSSIIITNALKEMSEAQQRAFKAALDESRNSGQRETSSGSVLEKHVLRQEIRKLPEFRGEAKEWPRFKATYDESSREGSFSNIQNLNRLQQCLKGRALEIVKPLMLNAENVPEILKQLENRFGQAKIIYNELLRDVLKIKLNKSDSKQLINLSEAVNNMVLNLQSIGGEDYLKDPRLISELIERLPFSLQMKWATKEAEATESLDISTIREGSLVRIFGLEEFNHWLKPIARATIYLPERSLGVEKRTVLNVHQDNKKGTRPNKLSPTITRKCDYCRGDHKLPACERFKRISQPKRWEFIREKHICGGCLQYSNHGIKDCRLKKPCGVNGCTINHHPLIHKNFEKNTETNKRKTTSEPSTSAPTNIHKSEPSEILYKTLPVTLYNKGRKLDTYAFLDDGSSSTLIETETADLLGLTGSIEPLCLKWTKGIEEIEEDSLKTSLEISGRNKPTKVYKMNNVKTISKLELPAQTLDISEMRKHKQFRSLPDIGYTEGTPTILIGLEHSNLLTSLETRTGDAGFPTAVKTKLGWAIYGKTEGKNREGRLYKIEEIRTEEKLLHAMVREFFTTENFGVNPGRERLQSADEKRAEQIINSTMRKVGDRYEIGLLWKDDHTSLPNSYGMAKGRLENIERKLKTNKELRDWYNDKIKEYVLKGYARKLSPAEARDNETHRTFYLPHFVVVNPNKLPLKPRLVFDAAAKVNGVSLNTELLTGPDNLASLYEILLKFREGKVAVTADIKEMFPQIRIKKEDQHSQRFLWRDVETLREPDVYVMEVMTFGATCSPSCAQAVKNFNAEVNRDDNPLACDAIINMHYVDDYLNSHHELEEAIAIANGIINIHKKGGFEIRNFISNSLELLEKLPESARATTLEDIKLNEDENTEKILGVFWRTKTDELVYKINKNKIPQKLTERKPTKREILSFVMSLFDPLGLIGHVIIQAKIILQAIWRTGTGWDEQIPDDLHKRWNHWFKGLNRIEKFRIKRCYSLLIPAADTIQLHVFSDASEEAFSAVVYLRIQKGTELDVTLVAAKTKVAPTKQLSIPRLELQAAVLGCRLAETIRKSLRINIDETIHWSDSTTVLGWIRSSTRKYKQFVAHRVSEILETTTMVQWRYVPTQINVADEATKETRSNHWFIGPDFLKEEPRQWPKQESMPEPDNEVRVMYTSITTQKYEWIKPEKYSSWNRLTKHIAIIVKFVDWLKRKRQVDSRISLQEIKEAEKIIIRKSQEQAYAEEISNLREKKAIGDNSKIKSLTPILDSDGILRLDGRIKNAKFLSKDARSPMILPSKDHITTLIVKDYHERNAHQGQETVVAKIRQKYWISALREVVKRVKRACQKCKNQAAKPQAPLMGQIPECKLKPYTKPFTYTGVDYFGPISVTVGRRREKRYGALFTCMTTRAVHIELARDLSTDAFILCLRNIQNRRGKIEEIYSDNATNFKGADKELQEKARNLGIVWKFIPPSSPHFGGSWERLVQAIKKTLAVILREQSPREDTLVSALIEAENIVNSRPLTPVPVEHMEEEPLTPNHFLFGPGGGQSAPATGYEGEEITRRQWKISQQIAKQFWKRWIREYLPTITRRGKWRKFTTPLQKGDVVVLTDDDVPRNKWRLGRIVDVNMASDGQVRSAVVKTKEGTYTRPAVKIAKLDTQQNEIEAQTLNPDENKINEKLRRSERIKSKNNYSFLGIIVETMPSKQRMTLRDSTAEWDEVKVPVMENSLENSTPEWDRPEEYEQENYGSHKEESSQSWDTIPEWDRDINEPETKITVPAENEYKSNREEQRTPSERTPKFEEDVSLSYRRLIVQRERIDQEIKRLEIKELEKIRSPFGGRLNVRYCYFCTKTNHTLNECEMFMSRCPGYRGRFVYENDICCLCLRTTNHRADDCLEMRCGMKNCHKKHHVIMHGTPERGQGISKTKIEKVLDWDTGLYPDHPYTESSLEEAKSIKDERLKPNVAIPWTKEIKEALEAVEEQDRKKTRNRSQTGGWGQYLIMLCLLVSTVSSQVIRPINSTGLILTHAGTVYAQTGSYRWTVDAKINRTDDMQQTIRQIEAMEKYCNAIQSYYPESSCHEYTLELRKHAHILSQRMRMLSRKRRSQGAFSWLWDFAFGSNNREEEIEMLRLKQHDLERQEKIAFKTVAETFDNATRQAEKRLTTIQEYVNNAINEANRWYRKFDKEIAKDQMSEYTSMIRLQLNELNEKYDRLSQKEGILSLEDLENGMHTIRSKLRNDQMLPLVNLTTMRKLWTSSIESTDEKVYIHIDVPILYNERFEKLAVIAIPKNGYEIKIRAKEVYVNYENHIYFYNNEQVSRIKLGLEMEIIPNLIFSKAEQHPDCVIATIFKSKEISKLCQVIQKTTEEDKIYKLATLNEFIVVTIDPQMVAVRCEHKENVMRHATRADGATALYVKAGPGCRIFTRSGFLISEARIEEKSKLAGTFYVAYNITIDPFKNVYIKPLDTVVQKHEKVQLEEDIIEEEGSSAGMYIGLSAGGSIILIILCGGILYFMKIRKERAEKVKQNSELELTSTPQISDRHEFQVSIIAGNYEGECAGQDRKDTIEDLEHLKKRERKELIK